MENNPWTSGLLVPYAIEAEVWAQYVAETYGEGATVAMFTVNNEFGLAYVDAFTAAAEKNGLEIVAEESIEAADSGAPSGQMTNIVAAAPDAILAVPLGAQCIAFMTELGNAKAANADFDSRHVPDRHVCQHDLLRGGRQRRHRPACSRRPT